jgi:hypothetical protein
LNLCKNALEVDLLLLYVFYLLWARRFAFDRDSARVTQPLQFCENLFEVDETFADDDLFA